MSKEKRKDKGKSQVREDETLQQQTHVSCFVDSNL